MANVAKVLSVAPIGFDGRLIEVECDIKAGLPSLQIVGLGNKAIDEAKERVRSATTNSLLDFPTKKITINLAPAELPKDGSHYDLSIAVAILVSSGQLRPEQVRNSVFAGELALDGTIRPVRGAVSIAETAKHAGIATVFLPDSNAEQALLVDEVSIVGITSLKQLYLHLKGEAIIQPIVHAKTDTLQNPKLSSGPTLDDIHGQETAKRAMIIAAAGRHNILLSGTPGAGKTMLAQTLVSLLPELSNEEKIAVTKLHSLAGETVDTVVDARPFRSPHHTASRIALIGGGNHPKPGEISLAHLGVLFLDEIPEYPRASLESLRQPLEDNHVSISRVNGKVEYPANFMLVATMNPCPCGYYGDPQKECRCTSQQILNYQQRLSGPLLDRIDLVVIVPRVSTDKLLHKDSSQSSQQDNANAAIKTALEAQALRYKRRSKYNADLTSREIKELIPLSSEVKQLLDTAAERLGVSARSYFKIIKVARTIADLDGASDIEPSHVAEALQYRMSTS